MSLLRNPDFQDLLVKYKRAKRTFLKAYEVEDEVSSAWLVRDLAGNEYKPEDYLAAFARFVKENPSDIEAIEILLEKPQRWSTQALTELHQKLEATPQRFTRDNLQKAHKLRYNKALVDIISMIKHAVREEEPLYTAEERVHRAFDKVTAGKQFTEEQKKWLDRIREHLISNLSIDMEDFEVVPIFTHYGGWNRANHIFGHRLMDILKELNEAIAA
jgi:type I restriction enzyme R subunit